MVEAIERINDNGEKIFIATSNPKYAYFNQDEAFLKDAYEKKLESLYKDKKGAKTRVIAQSVISGLALTVSTILAYSMDVPSNDIMEYGHILIGTKIPGFLGVAGFVHLSKHVDNLSNISKEIGVLEEKLNNIKKLEAFEKSVKK